MPFSSLVLRYGARKRSNVSWPRHYYLRARGFLRFKILNLFLTRCILLALLSDLVASLLPVVDQHLVGKLLQEVRRDPQVNDVQGQLIKEH